MQRVSVQAVSVQNPNTVTKRVCFQTPEVLVFVLTLGQGHSIPPHKHPGSALVMHVSAGSGLITVDGQEHRVQQGDVILLTGDEELGMQNPGQEPLVLLVSLSPNPSDPAFSREHG